MHLQAIKKPRERISRKLSGSTLSSEVFPLITVQLGAEALIREGGLLALLQQLLSWAGAGRPPSPRGQPQPRGSRGASPARSGGAHPRQPGEPWRARRPEVSRLAALSLGRKLRPCSPKGNLPLLAKKRVSSQTTALRRSLLPPLV